MSTLDHSGTKEIVTDMLPPHCDQQSEESVWLPFSGKLSVDDKLELSKAKFKETIRDFLKHKDKSTLSQLTATLKGVHRLRKPRD